MSSAKCISRNMLILYFSLQMVVREEPTSGCRSCLHVLHDKHSMTSHWITWTGLLSLHMCSRNLMRCRITGATVGYALNEWCIESDNQYIQHQFIQKYRRRHDTMDAQCLGLCMNSFDVYLFIGLTLIFHSIVISYFFIIHKSRRFRNTRWYWDSISICVI